MCLVCTPLHAMISPTKSSIAVAETSLTLLILSLPVSETCFLNPLETLIEGNIIYAIQMISHVQRLRVHIGHQTLLLMLLMPFLDGCLPLFVDPLLAARGRGRRFHGAVSQFIELRFVIKLHALIAQSRQPQKQFAVEIPRRVSAQSDAGRCNVVERQTVRIISACRR